MAIITYREAVREALREEMRRDERVFMLGEDIGVYGGALGVTTGMLEEFGPERIRNTPCSRRFAPMRCISPCASASISARGSAKSARPRRPLSA